MTAYKVGFYLFVVGPSHRGGYDVMCFDFKRGLVNPLFNGFISRSFVRYRRNFSNEKNQVVCVRIVCIELGILYETPVELTQFRYNINFSGDE